jgi:hypothetical protein
MYLPHPPVMHIKSEMFQALKQQFEVQVCPSLKSSVSCSLERIIICKEGAIDVGTFVKIDFGIN